MTPPKYQALTRGGIAETPLPLGKGLVRVISGTYEETPGPASTFTPVHMLDLRLKPGAHVRLPSPRDFNTALLVLAGSVKANGSPAVPAGEFILFKNDGDEVLVDSVDDAIVLFLSGAPIEEPLVHYGPFVMDSIDGINQAIVDFNSGKFGTLVD
jgi:redox-sensitive bicupin YhaK (pirin superfamily)